MPHATLLVMTSPILLGPVPPVSMAEVSAMVPEPVVAEALEGSAPYERAGLPQNILPLSWSLAQAQDGAQGQPTGSDQTPPEEGELDDGEQGETNEIVVEGEYGPPEGDPMAAVNETSYRIVQDIDGALIGPIAYGYRDGLPGPIRDGLGNVVRNLREPANFLNFLLQFKIGDAFETLGRFAINSTIGVGGLFDVAGNETFNLPYRRNGFANTLGYYGVEPGAYLYLPIAGATTVRDLIGDTLDQAVLPIAVGKPFDTPEYGVPYFVISNLEARLEVDNELAAIEGAVDPYAARRDTYLYYREREIALLKGEEPPERPAIVTEIEEITEEIQLEEEAEAAQDEIEDGAPQISNIDTRELPPIAARIAITQPRTR
ncbi:MAG: MlaA family lipoprotein [Erythrobacter sp.]